MNKKFKKDKTKKAFNRYDSERHPEPKVQEKSELAGRPIPTHFPGELEELERANRPQVTDDIASQVIREVAVEGSPEGFEVALDELEMTDSERPLDEVPVDEVPLAQPVDVPVYPGDLDAPAVEDAMEEPVPTDPVDLDIPVENPDADDIVPVDEPVIDVPPVENPEVEIPVEDPVEEDIAPIEDPVEPV